MQNFFLLEHPLALHKLSFLRDKNTSSAEFRGIFKEISKFLVYEASKDLKTRTIGIETPMAATEVQRIIEPPVVVSIMRAGNGMLDAIMDVMPFASAGHIGIYRDKFIKNTVEYYFKLPDKVQGKLIFLVEPLIATGDTAIAAIERLKQYEVGEIRMLSIVAAKQGLEDIFHAHSDVKIYSLAVESKLDDKGYLIPGVGDAGDRLYNTKAWI
ncbi:MAG: uracil phosphoribosyltransferase [Oligoflexales bacterium]|nr:uracil phosphoribosyltransferase [Oligoflexales bacterium]